MSPTGSSEPSKVQEIPSRLPPITGKLVEDSLISARHVVDLPCARNALLAGIASGVGMGAIRGITAGPLMAGNWAIGTFALISLGSWHLCQRHYVEERRKITQVIEQMPRRSLKKTDNAEGTSS